MRLCILLFILTMSLSAKDTTIEGYLVFRQYPDIINGVGGAPTDTVSHVETITNCLSTDPESGELATVITRLHTRKVDCDSIHVYYWYMILTEDYLDFNPIFDDPEEALTYYSDVVRAWCNNIPNY